MSAPDHPDNPTLPKTSDDVLRLVSLASSLELIGSTLIPTLHALCAPSSSAGGKSRQRSGGEEHKGEELLSSVLDDLVGDDVKLQRYTAAIVYALSARLHRVRKVANQQNKSLLQLATHFFGVADPQQLSMCRQRESSLAWGVLRLAQGLKCVPDVVRPLLTLVSNPPPPVRLRPGHAALLEACLLSRDYRPLSYISFQAISLDPGAHGLNYLDVLTFLHHAGLANVALHRFGEARDYFLAAASAPTNSASAIQLAAAKRAILCDLLILTGEKDGRQSSLFPRYTSSSVQRIIERQAERYTSLQKAIESRNWSSAREIAGNPEFEDDKNSSLLQLVIQTIPARQILYLRHTYSRLSLANLAAKLDSSTADGFAQLKAILANMIQTGLLVADISITQAGEEVVSFSDPPEDRAPSLAPSGPASAQWLSLQSRVQQDSMLEYRLSCLSQDMSLAPALLKKQADWANVSGGGGKMARGRDDMESMMDIELPGPKKGAGVGTNWADTGF